MFKHLYKALMDKAAGRPSELDHYSPRQGLKHIDPKYKGTGVDSGGRAANRAQGHQYSFFYRAGSEPEHVVTSGSNSKYVVDMPEDSKLYDLASDPAGIIGSLRNKGNVNPGMVDMDQVHGAIKEAGYHGFFNSAHPHLANVVALYQASPVKREEPVRKAEDDSDDFVNKIKGALADVGERSYRQHMASMPAGGIHAAPEHAQNFLQHLAGAGHHAVMGQVSHDLHEESQYPEEDRIYTHPQHGSYPMADWAKLKEAHHGLAQDHLNRARHIAAKHPDVWEHLGRVSYEDKPMAAAAAAALHPHAFQHTFEPKGSSQVERPGDHFRELQDFAWTQHPGAEEGKPWKHTLQNVGEPRKATPQEVADAANAMMEGSATAMTGEGDDPRYHPGAGHASDRLLGEPLPAPRHKGGNA